MALESFLQGASLLQLTEALVSKADQAYLQLESKRSSGHLGEAGFRMTDVTPLDLQHIGQREPKHSTSSCELTNSLWTVTSQISSSINKARPIYRLPPEILAEIITWYQLLESTERYNWFTWVRLMSVSHTWRSTILSFPSLWSVVHLDSEISPQTVHMLFQRSRGHSLDVTIPQLPEHPGPMLKMARYSHMLEASLHVSRIRKFVYYSESGNDTIRLIRTFYMPAPNLTHLELGRLILQPETISFPNLFGMEFPKLRVLEVAGITWPEVVGANLTTIAINDSLNPWLLKGCIPYSPNLKALKIRCIWDFNGPDLRTWQRITLPPGIRLSIKYSQVSPAILALFALPRDGYIKVTPSVHTFPYAPMLSYILPTDISHLQNMGTLTRLHIKAHFNLGLILEVKCFRLDLPVFRGSLRYPFESQMASFRERAPLAMWLLDNLDQIVLKGVEELRIEGFAGSLEPHAAELLALLGRLPALTRLVTTDDNEELLRCALNNLGCRAVVVRAGR